MAAAGRFAPVEGAEARGANPILKTDDGTGAMFSKMITSTVYSIHLRLLLRKIYLSSLRHNQIGRVGE